jgi:hypothetical protein
MQLVYPDGGKSTIVIWAVSNDMLIIIIIVITRVMESGQPPIKAD